ncbi:MAG TPA: 3-hydroxybutyryl-CoA dehydrogenase, partial [Longimicrobiales bacterium]|nr:3-hydroxybutyryl-CoA dehydrogenase [Longimicrobiales bacterium]
MPEIRRVAVLGCGLMGSGIAEVAARAGYETQVREINEEFAQKGLARIRKSLDRAVDKGKLDVVERDTTLSRITTTTELKDLASVDIVIEAVTEDLDTKNGMFGELDTLCAADTIFASNTSSLNIASMAAATSRPDRFVGLHFFNPVPVMKLVEVVRSIATSRDAYDRAFAFARTLGKEPVEARDTSGFIVNRLLVPYMLDAIRCLEAGLATTEDIDKSMTLGTGHPMGPFVLCDFVGIDTLYYIAEIMFDEFREPRFAPP